MLSIVIKSIENADIIKNNTNKAIKKIFILYVSVNILNLSFVFMAKIGVLPDFPGYPIIQRLNVARQAPHPYPARNIGTNV